MSTKTHRCPDCEQQVEHSPDELCPSCGRCDPHCLEDNHFRMERVQFETVGEGTAARKVPLPIDRQIPPGRARA